MPVPPHPKLSLLMAIGALAISAPGCATDDAAERDAKDAAEEVENSNVDEKVERGIEDVDGK